MIRCVYETAPNFPATDQHPDAARYEVGSYIVDAVGGEPSLDEVQAFLNPPQDIKAQILAIEAGQHSVMREYALGSIEAGERLVQIDEQIAELRAKLK